MSPFTYVIGLEIHVELSTATKMFCRCANDPFGNEPNAHTCPICVGLPGTLPVPNREAVRRTILVGKAIGSSIPEFCKFDRKHYFYPDLPKGYQISQYDLPLCVGGELDLLDVAGNPEKTVRFERVHLEEDAGKLLHGAQTGYSQVDLSRAGVPLMEMVTKPDLSSPEEARRFMQELRLLVRTLGVAEADMEKGQMRADVNVSIKFKHEGEDIWTPVTEIKNVNSTRAVEQSLKFEAQRLYDEWLAGGPVRTRKNKLTAGWNEDKQTVNIQRAKEAANDYRYFPEPDIPPLEVYGHDDLNPHDMKLPELPNDRRRRYIALALSASDIEIFLNDTERQSRFEALAAAAPEQAKASANWLVNAPESLGFSNDELLELVGLAADGQVAFAAIKPRLAEVVAAREGADEPLSTTLERLDLLQTHDDSVVQSAIADVLAEQAKAVEQYRAGDTKVLGFLVGQVLRKAQGKANPAKAQEALLQALT